MGDCGNGLMKRLARCIQCAVDAASKERWKKIKEAGLREVELVRSLIEENHAFMVLTTALDVSSLSFYITGICAIVSRTS
jgi:hypothetical protein